MSRLIAVPSGSKDGPVGRPEGGNRDRERHDPREHSQDSVTKSLEKRGRVMPHVPNVYVFPCFQIHLAPSSHHGDGVANGHLRGRHHCEVGDVDEQVADCDLFGDMRMIYMVVQQDSTPKI